MKGVIIQSVRWYIIDIIIDIAIKIYLPIFIVSLVILLFYIITYVPIQFIAWIAWLLPLPRRETRREYVIDFLCDVVYPWYWNNLPRRWRNRQNRKRNPNMKTVTLYTDGACSGNPGPGGWGVVLLYDGHEKQLSGGEKNTTNNRMELTAVIKGLEALKEPCIVELYSDSKYVIDALEKGWAKGWKARGWVKSDKKPAMNPDLWERLLELCGKHVVNLHWVKGHSNNPFNERCDLLAVGEWMKLR